MKASAPPKKPRNRNAENAYGYAHDVVHNRFAAVDMNVLRNAFDRFDKDGSGALEQEECVAALAFLGAAIKFDDLDRSKDGKVGWEEFVVFSQVVGRHTHPVFKKASTATTAGTAYGVSPASFFSSADPQVKEAFLKSTGATWRRLTGASGAVLDEKAMANAFAAIDVNKDGYLTMRELRRAIKHLAPQASELDLTLMIALIDKSGDDKVSLDEFLEVVKHGADERLTRQHDAIQRTSGDKRWAGRFGERFG